MNSNNRLARRDFLTLIGRGGAGLAGVSVIGLPGFQEAFAAALTHVPVLWLQGGGCSGCSVSVLNSVSPTIQDLLLGEVIPGKHLSLAFHPNVMAGQGHGAVGVLEKYKKSKPGGFILVVEGSISTKDDGIYCEVGERNGHGITVLTHLLELAPKALAVANVGTCSSYGGIPMAPPNPTGIEPVSAILKQHGIKTPVVNIPGCPPHPDWFIGTVATVLIGGLKALDVDSQGRLKAFYGQCIHDNCQFRGHFEERNLAREFGEKACLFNLGCKGPSTYADCPKRKWNGGVNWCIGCGSPCIGCVEPDFPYEEVILKDVDINFDYSPGAHPPIIAERVTGTEKSMYGVGGAVAGVAIGIGLASARKKKSPDVKGDG